MPSLDANAKSQKHTNSEKKRELHPTLSCLDDSEQKHTVNKGCRHKYASKTT